MIINFILNSQEVADPDWTFDDHKRKVYYAYRYAYIRYRCRRGIGFSDTFDVAIEKMGPAGELIDLSEILSPKEIYYLTLPSFYEGENLTLATEDAFFDDIEKTSIPHYTLIEKITNILKGQRVVTDVLLVLGDTKIVIPFMTKTIAFIYVSVDNIDDLPDNIFSANIIRQQNPFIETVYVIGLLDSSLTSISNIG